MKLRFTVGLFAAASGLFVAGSALASTKKSSNSTISGSVPKAGTLVAMNGSGSLSSNSGARSSYMGMRILPFVYQGLKTTVKNTTTETPKTTLTTMPKTLDFYGRFGSWSVRPSLSLEADVPSTIGLDYDLSPNLEVGGFLSYQRTAVTTPVNDKKTDTVESFMAVGPQAFYYTEVAGFPVEAEARFAMLFLTKETSAEGKTEKNRDVSGYAFEAGGKVIREVSSDLEFFAGALIGYSSQTDKTNKDAEVTVSGVELTILPAGLRFKF